MRPNDPLLTRLSVVWGSADRIAAPPDLAVLDRAVYLPAHGGAGHSLVPADAYPGTPDTAPDGFYILLDSMAGHYGHFITDVLSCVWPVLGAHDAPVRFLCRPGSDRAVWESHPFIGEILAGLGLGYEAVVGFDTPVVLPRAARPAPSFRSLTCVHDVFGELCRQAGRGYWHADEVDTLARPAYMAKTRLTSGMHCLVNEGEVAAELDRLGVDILYPETMSFAEQVRAFARRRVVLGPVGSAFHTAAFSAPGRRVIGLSAMLHLNSNHVMFDAIGGNRAYYYFASGTQHGSKEGFGLSWTLHRPRAVAAELLRRAEHFDRIDDVDAASATAGADRPRSLADRIGRLRSLMAATWQRRRPYR